jgi:hypothetical protein
VARVRKRRENRFQLNHHEPIAVYAGVNRLEGKITDESVSGVGAVFPSHCGLKEQQKVQLAFRKTRRAATVAYVAREEEGEHIGFILKQ